MAEEIDKVVFSYNYYCVSKQLYLSLSMISLRNIPFFAVGLAVFLLGALAFKNDCPYVWYILALVYFVLGFAFRKPIDTSDGGH